MPRKNRERGPRKKGSGIAEAHMPSHCPATIVLSNCPHEVVTRLALHPHIAHCACGRTVTKFKGKWVVQNTKDCYTGKTAFTINPENEPDYGRSYEKIAANLN